MAKDKRAREMGYLSVAAIGVVIGVIVEGQRAVTPFTDAIVDFISAMEAEGIRAVEPIAQRLTSGELIRFRCEGDGTGRQNG